MFETRPAALLSTNADRLATGQKRMREVGGSGVPTLVLVDGSSRRLLDSRAIYDSGDELLALIGIERVAA